MEAFETTLTGSDGDIAGIVTQLGKGAYRFTSVDDALHLTIAKNQDGKWTRLAGSEPYFTGWVDELTEKIAAQAKADRHTAIKKTAPPTSVSKKAKVSSAAKSK